VVILFADDLGYGDLSSFGHPTIRTPRLDAVAAAGIRLTSFYVGAPSCTPSRAALLTGRYPQRVGLPNVLGPDSENGIPAEELTLAEALKEKGYRTMAIGKWHLGSSRPEYLPTANGFDSYFGLLYSNDMIPPWVETERPLQLYRDTKPASVLTDQSLLTEHYTTEAVKFIHRAADQPFFLYLAYSMPHVPISTGEDFTGRSRAGLYGDVIETIDWSAGRIVDTLDELGLSQNTVLIFTSDNGPWLNMPDRMFKDGIVKPWHAGSPGLLRGAKATTYEGGVRVPAMVRWPAQIPAGQVSAEAVTTMDLFVTLCNIAEAELPSARTYDGIDIRPLLTQGAAVGERNLFYFNGTRAEAVRRGPWKLRLPGGLGGEAHDEAVEPVQLFNLEIDPGEHYNRARDFPAIAADLKQRLQEGALDVLGSDQSQAN
jgi:arylsulfatase A-like enzyme